MNVDNLGTSQCAAIDGVVMMRTTLRATAMPRNGNLDRAILPRHAGHLPKVQFSHLADKFFAIDPLAGLGQSSRRA
jgi:hypothetical protein